MAIKILHLSVGYKGYLFYSEVQNLPNLDKNGNFNLATEWLKR
jgi:hypothetical protein